MFVGVPRMDNCPGGSAEVSSACWCLPLYTTVEGTVGGDSMTSTTNPAITTSKTTDIGSESTATSTFHSTHLAGIGSGSVSLSSISSSTSVSVPKTTLSASRSTFTSRTEIVPQSFGVAVDDEVGVMNLAGSTNFAGETIILPQKTDTAVYHNVTGYVGVLSLTESTTEFSLASEVRSVLGISYATVVVTETVFLTRNATSTA